VHQRKGSTFLYFFGFESTLLARKYSRNENRWRCSNYGKEDRKRLDRGHSQYFFLKLYSRLENSPRKVDSAFISRAARVLEGGKLVQENPPGTNLVFLRSTPR